VKRVIFHSGAEFDLQSAAAFYERQRRGLGRELRQEIEAAVARIRENPRQYPVHTERGTRKCVAGRFPYTIFFAELQDSIWVAAIAHQKRRPGYWRGRRPEES
jgi:toxin ParE1/3/4